MPSTRLSLGKRTLIMGILNLTPDSFFDGGKYTDPVFAKECVLRMFEEGADIIDLGGQSSRPGADEIPEEEELRRVLPVLKAVRRETSKPISVDTYRSNVARACLDEGADMINDISGFRFDSEIVKVASKFKAPCVVMHITAKPKVMQKNILPDNVLINTVKSYLQESMKLAEEHGVETIIDPGIGFGKKPEQNLTLIANLPAFAELERPILVGPSRKSFIGYALGGVDKFPPSERLEGSLAAAVICALKGAHIVRVHDIKETKRAFAVADAIISGKFR